MPRGPRTAHDRLLNLLYKKTVPEIKPRVPLVKRVLYEQAPSTERTKSALDGLMEYEWNRKPMEKAIEDVCQRIPDIKKSIVLRLNCKNAFVGKSDLTNIYPVSAERHYLLKGSLKNGLNFHYIKARNPFSLLFLGAYYLIFSNFNQACVYYLETMGKQINGLDLDLQFLELSENHLKRMSSPFLAHPAPIDNFEYNSENYGKIPINEIFDSSPTQLGPLKHLKRYDLDRSAYRDRDLDPLFNILGLFLGQGYRDRLVIVRNLPFGVTGPAIESLLWEYEFENEDNPQESITNLYSNASTQVTVALLKFKDHTNARRFVRNFHGRRWEKVTNRKEKALYDPILCEIAE